MCGGGGGVPATPAGRSGKSPGGSIGADDEVMRRMCHKETLGESQAVGTVSAKAQGQD